MNSALAHSARRYLKPVLAPPQLIICGFAVLTIALALAIQSLGSPLGTIPVIPDGSTAEYSHLSSLTLHAHALITSAILFAGVGFALHQNEDYTLLRMAIEIGGVITITILLLAATTPSSVSTLVETLFTRPLLTIAALLIGATYVAVLNTRFDWLLINVAGLVFAPPVIASLGTAPLDYVVVALAITAVLDYLAVHRTSAMASVANTLITYRIPVAIFAPTTSSSLSNALSTDSEGEFNVSGIQLLGLGDVVIPGTFIVALASTYGVSSLPVSFALCGYVFAYAALRTDPFEKAAYAALPFLNTGVFLGATLAMPLG